MINIKSNDDIKIIDVELKSTCTCKGIRTCIICEGVKKLKKKEYDLIVDLTEYIKKIEFESGEFKIRQVVINQSDEIKFYQNLFEILEKDKERIEGEINLKANNIEFGDNFFDGLYLINNFLHLEEAEETVKEMHSLGWNNSQSGRKKQDYGPKINYKKRKVKHSTENVIYPEYLDKFIINKLKLIPSLNNFSIAEMGNLFYSPINGSCIDPHIDDYWIWGRIIGINLLSPCIITFSKEIQTDSKNVLFEINIPLGENDLYLMTNHSRYTWKHSIKRENIPSDRMVITLREYEAGFKTNNK